MGTLSRNFSEKLLSQLIVILRNLVEQEQQEDDRKLPYSIKIQIIAMPIPSAVVEQIIIKLTWYHPKCQAN